MSNSLRSERLADLGLRPCIDQECAPWWFERTCASAADWHAAAQKLAKLQLVVDVTSCFSHLRLFYCMNARIPAAMHCPRLSQPPSPVHVAVAVLAPVFKLDAELDAAVGCFEKISLIETQGVVEIDNGGNRRLTDADNADVVGFNKRDRNDFA